MLSNPFRKFERRQQASGEGQHQERSALETQVGKLRQGLARLIDSYTEGLIEKDEFEPRVTRLRQRIAHIEAQCDALADEELLHREMHLIVSRLDDFSAQVGRHLDELEWAKKREIIRALVRRVEVGLEQVQVVFRVDSFPGESDPGKKACNFVGGVVSPSRHTRQTVHYFSARVKDPEISKGFFMRKPCIHLVADLTTDEACRLGITPGIMDHRFTGCLWRQRMGSHVHISISHLNTHGWHFE
jgi:site-specific DNA recombinase